MNPFPRKPKTPRSVQITKSLIPLYLIFPGTVLSDTLNCPCKVVEVIDGDTVFVQDQFRSSRKVWLAGIDAPEPRQTYGKDSKQNLAQLVLGKGVEVEFLKRDRFGRIIGKLSMNGQDINKLQLDNGFAWYFRQGRDELSEQDHALYRTAEKKAKAQGLGLWSSYSPIPPWEFRSKQKN